MSGRVTGAGDSGQGTQLADAEEEEGKGILGREGRIGTGHLDSWEDAEICQSLGKGGLMGRGRKVVSLSLPAGIIQSSNAL